MTESAWRFLTSTRPKTGISFRAAFSKLDAPGQNVMYADVDGNIGYQATGRVPIRASGDGSLPVSGSDDAHEWKGYIPFDDMPHVYDPPNGILATANGRIAPDDYKYSISTEWEAPWRTDRIYRVLESGKKFSPADMLALQMDVSSTYDRFIADKFVYALDHAPKLSDRAKHAADILRDWDGRMSADSPAPTIETKARMELVTDAAGAKAGRSAGRCVEAAKSAAASKCAKANTGTTRRADLEELSLGNVDGVARKRAQQTARALAAAGIFRLRSAADGGRGECPETSRGFLPTLRNGSGERTIRSRSIISCSARCR